MTDDTPPTDRRRRRFLAAAAAMTSVLAGCGSDSGNGPTTDQPTSGGDGGEDDTSTATSTPMETTTASDGGGGEYTKEEMGQVVTDEIDEIEILGWTSEVLSGPSLFQVEMTLRNAGNQETRITPGAFALVLTYYDDNGSTLGEGRHVRVEKRNLPSGETAFVSGNVELADPSVVASYDISLTCDDTSMSVYC